MVLKVFYCYLLLLMPLCSFGQNDSIRRMPRFEMAFSVGSSSRGNSSFYYKELEEQFNLEDTNSVKHYFTQYSNALVEWKIGLKRSLLLCKSAHRSSFLQVGFQFGNETGDYFIYEGNEQESFRIDTLTNSAGEYFYVDSIVDTKYEKNYSNKQFSFGLSGQYLTYRNNRRLTLSAGIRYKFVLYYDQLYTSDTIYRGFYKAEGLFTEPTSYKAVPTKTKQLQFFNYYHTLQFPIEIGYFVSNEANKRVRLTATLIPGFNRSLHNTNVGKYGFQFSMLFGINFGLGKN